MGCKWEWEEGGPCSLGGTHLWGNPRPPPYSQAQPPKPRSPCPLLYFLIHLTVSPRPGQTEGSCHAFIPEHLWTVCSMPTGRRGPGDTGTCVTQPPPQVNSQAWKDEDLTFFTHLPLGAGQGREASAGSCPHSQGREGTMPAEHSSGPGKGERALKLKPQRPGVKAARGRGALSSVL